MQLSIFHMRWRKRLLIDNHYLNSILKRLYFTLEQLSINISWILSIYLVCLMMFNATFNNITVISWWSVLLVEETGVPVENHRPVVSHWQTLSHNGVHLSLIEIRPHNNSGDIHWLHTVVNPTTIRSRHRRPLILD